MTLEFDCLLEYIRCKLKMRWELYVSKGKSSEDICVIVGFETRHENSSSLFIQCILILIMGHIDTPVLTLSGYRYSKGLSLLVESILKEYGVTIWDMPFCYTAKTSSRVGSPFTLR